MFGNSFVTVFSTAKTHSLKTFLKTVNTKSNFQTVFTKPQTWVPDLEELFPRMGSSIVCLPPPRRGQTLCLYWGRWRWWKETIGEFLVGADPGLCQDMPVKTGIVPNCVIHCAQKGTRTRFMSTLVRWRAQPLVGPNVYHLQQLSGVFPAI